jgi:hypothetical protein
VEVRGQIYASAALPLGKESALAIEYVGWAPQPSGRIGKEKNLLPVPGI